MSAEYVMSRPLCSFLPAPSPAARAGLPFRLMADTRTPHGLAALVVHSNDFSLYFLTGRSDGRVRAQDRSSLPRDGSSCQGVAGQTGMLRPGEVSPNPTLLHLWD